MTESRLRHPLVLGATAVLAAFAGAAGAQEIETNFAGSAQLDYFLVPSTLNARGFTFDGFTTELSLKLAVDFSENISANVKICFGCHGFETDMAFVDLRAFDQLNFRVGRFNPSFGDFPLRHDPANHRANSKPLPYDMGRMIRLREWNLGVLPSPYVDNGLEINGTQWFSDDVQLDYAAYIVSGLKGQNDGFDVDFRQSRSGSLYYVDNNSEPAFGGRLALTANFGDFVSATAGASAMYGRYDPARELAYFIAGVDLYIRIEDLNLRGEYLVRRTDFSVGSDPGRFRYAFGDPSRNYSVKEGFYVEAEYPVWEYVELLYRFDGLRRIGNVPSTSPLRSTSAVLRHTAGGNVLMGRGVRFKITGELWDFSDFDDELAFHFGVVANF